MRTGINFLPSLPRGFVSPPPLFLCSDVNDFPPADKDQINTITGQGVAIPCAGADYAPSNEESDILTGNYVCIA